MAIARKGGIEAVVAAMDAHKGNADVQHYGCRALDNLGVNGTVGRACLCWGVRVPCGPSVCGVHVWRRRGVCGPAVGTVGGIIPRSYIVAHRITFLVTLSPEQTPVPFFHAVSAYISPPFPSLSLFLVRDVCIAFGGHGLTLF